MRAKAANTMTEYTASAISMRRASAVSADNDAPVTVAYTASCRASAYDG